MQALLGHSSSEITREVYLHSIPADARKAVEKVEGLVIGPNVIGPKWSPSCGGARNNEYSNSLILWD